MDFRRNKKFKPFVMPTFGPSVFALTVFPQTEDGEASLQCVSASTATAAVLHAGQAQIKSTSTASDSSAVTHAARAQMRSIASGTPSAKVIHVAAAALIARTTTTMTVVVRDSASAVLASRSASDLSASVRHTAATTLASRTAAIASAHGIGSATVSISAQSSTTTTASVLHAGSTSIHSVVQFIGTTQSASLGGSSALGSRSSVVAAAGVLHQAAASITATPGVAPNASTTSFGYHVGGINSWGFNAVTFDGPDTLIAPAQARLTCEASFLRATAQLTHYVQAQCFLPCRASVTPKARLIYNIVIIPTGVVVGGDAVVSYIQNGCGKPPLPHHPVPSIADYSPQTVAPLIDFFTPIVSGVVGSHLTHCNLIFRYENNTPCNPNDDIFVKHPLCIGETYTPPGQHPCGDFQKSPELLKYEAYAKKSKRLKDFMINSPAHIEYFHDICFKE